MADSALPQGGAGHDFHVHAPSSISATPDALPYALIERYGGPVPRYTSYPTAASFTELDPDTMLRSWMPEPPRPLSLYVHLPFCRSVCFFCGCHAVHTRDPRRAEAYLDDLDHEISAVSRAIGGRRPVVQMHWGGGTPTFLEPVQLARLSRMLRDAFLFSPDAECGIEVDPRVVTRGQLAVLGAEGFERLSLGVQDLDPRVQQAINRLQPAEMTREVIATARDLGFSSISIDLIHGLPLQTRAGFRDTIAAVVEMGPDRISLFSFAYLPGRIRHQRAIRGADLPDPAERLGMWADACAMLAGSGYRHIGMDHFARPDDALCRAQDEGRLQRNFQGYSTHGGCDVLGFGVSAISSLGPVYAQNEKDLSLYRSMVRSRGWATVRGCRLDAEDLSRRRLIMELMCHFRADWEEVGRKPGPGERAALEEMERDGLLTLDDRGMEVLPHGRFFIRSIAAVFDTRSAESGAMFSRTL